jgi:hypothetical protein
VLCGRVPAVSCFLCNSSKCLATVSLLSLFLLTVGAGDFVDGE